MKRFILIILVVIILFFGASLLIGHNIFSKDLATKQEQLKEIQQSMPENAPPCCKPPYGEPIIHNSTDQFFLNLYLRISNKYEMDRWIWAE
jgi:hypothetical protein